VREVERGHILKNDAQWSPPPGYAQHIVEGQPCTRISVGAKPSFLRLTGVEIACTLAREAQIKMNIPNKSTGWCSRLSLAAFGASDLSMCCMSRKKKKSVLLAVSSTNDRFDAEISADALCEKDTSTPRRDSALWTARVTQAGDSVPLQADIHGNGPDARASTCMASMTLSSRIEKKR